VYDPAVVKPLRVTLVAAAVALLVSDPSPAAAASAGPVLKTGGRIVDLAADGVRVAIAAEATARTCDRIMVWSPARSSSSFWNAYTSCPPGDEGAGEHLVEVGIAGTTVAWVEALLGNLQDLVLYRATVGSSARTRVAIAENHGGADRSPEGAWLGGLRGDGSLLAYNRWSVCIAFPTSYQVDPPPRPPCDRIEPPGDDPIEVAYDEGLYAIGDEAPLVEGPAGFRVAAVDGGLVALRHVNGGITIREARGGTLSRIEAPKASIAGVGLSGDRLVLLRNSVLEVYNVSNGAHLRTVGEGIPTTARLTDLHGGIAVVVSRGTLRLVRIADGKMVVRNAPATIVDAEIEPSGLVYAWNTSRAPRGRVAFVPLATVLGWFS
jgi:hypothetical protein